MRHIPMTADVTAAIRTGLHKLLPTLRPWLRVLVLSIGFTAVGIIGHAVVLGLVVPPISITSAHGPEAVPIDRLWDRSTEGWDEDETPFRRRLTLLDEQIVARDVQEPYVDRLVTLFRLSMLSLIAAGFFAFRSGRLGILEALSRFVFVVLIPSALVTILVYQQDPRSLHLTWSARHPAPCADAPIPPPP